jgi:hypothetical protein
MCQNTQLQQNVRAQLKWEPSNVAMPLSVLNAKHVPRGSNYGKA